MFTCTPFYLANFVFLFEVSLLPFCSTHRFRFLRLPLVSPIGCLVLVDFPRAYSYLYTLHYTPYTRKITPIIFFIWSYQKNVVPLHSQFHAGDVCTSSAGVADILKRRLLRSVLTLWNVASFKLMFQDLATIDALRDIDYPSCAYFGTLFAHMCMRARVP